MNTFSFTLDVRTPGRIHVIGGPSEYGEGVAHWNNGRIRFAARTGRREDFRSRGASNRKARTFRVQQLRVNPGYRSPSSTALIYTATTD